MGECIITSPYISGLEPLAGFPMVSVKHPHSPSNSKVAPEASAWLDGLASRYGPEELALIRRACEFAEPAYAGRLDSTGSPLFASVLGAAAILVEQRLD